MSASREKARRRDEREEGTEKRQVQKKKSYMAKKRANRIKGIAGIIVALFVVVIVFVNSGFVYKNMTAVKIGNTKFSATDVNFYYWTTYYNYYSNVYSTYGDYASYFLPSTDSSFDSQTYSDDQTWADYFMESALETMQKTVMLCQEAEDAGFTLSDEAKQSIEDTISSNSTSYSSNGYKSLKAFYEGAYGQGMTEDIYRENLEMYTLASYYAQEVYNSYEYSDDDLEEYYQENKDDYDIISYRSYYFSGAEVEADEENGIEGVDSETAMANAKTNADAMAEAATSEAIFADLAREYAGEDSTTYDDDDSTLSRSAGSSLSSTYSEWLLDENRTYGETTVIEASSGYYVVMFVDRNDNHYDMVNVRHILVMAETDDDGEYTDEALAEAEATAEEIYQEWQDGDATEDSFAELANERSDDSGSNTNGGLYENIYQNEMVTNFNDWIFDDREVGDTGIVFGSSSNYEGYHVLYFSGYGDLYSNYLADTDKRSEEYSDWEDTQSEYYVISKKFAFRFTDK